MSPVRQLDEVIERLKQLADGRMEGDAQTAALLKSEVIEPVATVGTGDQSSTAAAKRKNQSALARRARRQALSTRGRGMPKIVGCATQTVGAGACQAGM